ncbi:MAG: tRNA (N(6)-L-threonylcarbamoyladenosine(37)-C(2))-methylthiotransferase MtaB [Chloroflexi bacterium]|nr:tRNA (N(6)-L-threonylcarbamoyladenosine(37)-C(2))-methylthiotransferase MtaB [Chloroflexota bacterium]
MSRIAIESLGCKLNQAEVDSLARQLASRGYLLTESTDEADVYVLNTCTVTHIADRKSRHLLRAARRRSPQALIVALGCYAQRDPGMLERSGIADLALSHDRKEALAEIVESIRPPRGGQAGDPASGRRHRTRSMVKIQVGCNQFCSFCVVPLVRGPERSLPPEDVLQDVRERLAAGHREIVLTGTNIGRYTWNGQRPQGLAGLVERILSGTDITRLRLSSLRPHDLTPELAGLWSDERLCPHVHIPLQSGCESTLRRMNRPYSLADYARAVQSIREAVPALSVTTDVMVGFPGESAGEFEESYRFCAGMDFAGMHVFPYSARPGTPAAEMPDGTPDDVKRGRLQRMLALARQSARHYRLQFLGQTMNVLWEGESGGGTWEGLTANYIRVSTRSSEDLGNRLLPVKLTAEKGQVLLGENIEGGYIGHG